MKQQKSTVTPEKIEILKQAMGVDSISLRDRFAIAAVTSGIYKGSGNEMHAEHAYALADALLEERNKPNTGE